MNKKNIAFTMAEVMLVIGIIGVVATLTLPTLQKSTDTQINTAQAKKMYADLITAFDRANIKYGNFNSWPTTDPGKVLFNRLTRFLDVNKTCTAAAPNECWSGSATANSYQAALLSDGSSLMITNSSSSTIVIDVDGPKKGTSTIGKDLFNLYTNANVLGSSLQGYSGTTTPTSSTTIDATNYLYWVITYGNEDYLSCPSTVKFDTITTCN